VKGIRDRVFIVYSKTARKIISDATQTPDEEAHTLLMAASILRKAVWIMALRSSLMVHFPIIVKNHLFQNV